MGPRRRSAPRPPEKLGFWSLRTQTPGIDPDYVTGLVDLVLERVNGTPDGRPPAPDRHRPLVRRVPSRAAARTSAPGSSPPPRASLRDRTRDQRRADRPDPPRHPRQPRWRSPSRRTSPTAWRRRPVGRSSSSPSRARATRTVPRSRRSAAPACSPAPCARRCVADEVRRPRALAQGPADRAVPGPDDRRGARSVRTPATSSCARTAPRSRPCPRARRSAPARPRRAAQLRAQAPRPRRRRHPRQHRHAPRPGGRRPRRRRARGGRPRAHRPLSAATELLDLGFWPSAPGQGALAVEIRADEADDDLLAALRKIEHAPTRLTVTAEREVLAKLEAGCSAPIGATAVVDAELLLVSARPSTAPTAPSTARASHAAVLDGLRAGPSRPRRSRSAAASPPSCSRTARADLAPTVAEDTRRAVHRGSRPRDAGRVGGTTEPSTTATDGRAPGRPRPAGWRVGRPGRRGGAGSRARARVVPLITTEPPPTPPRSTLRSPPGRVRWGR